MVCPSDSLAPILISPHSLDEGFKSSAYLTGSILDPDFGHAHESNKTALNKALNYRRRFVELV
jgi:hypothetical protein